MNLQSRSGVNENWESDEIKIVGKKEGAWEKWKRKRARTVDEKEVILSKHSQQAAERWRSYTMSGDVISGEQCGKITGIYLQQIDNSEQWTDCDDCPESKQHLEYHNSISSLTSTALKRYSVLFYQSQKHGLLVTSESSTKIDFLLYVDQICTLVSESCITVKQTANPLFLINPTTLK